MEKGDMMEASEMRGKKCCCGKNKTTIGGLIALGITFAVAAVFLPQVYKTLVKKKLVLVKDGLSYNLWNRPPDGVIKISYYVFNYTNVVNMLSSTVNSTDESLDERDEPKPNPNVTQLGPYTYRQLRVNEVIDYNADEITYVENYTYIFDPSQSCPNCSESDEVIVPNVAAMTMFDAIYDKLKDESSFIINAAMALGGPPLFKKFTIKEVIWGYNDDLISWINGLPFYIKGPLLRYLKRNGINVPKDSRIQLFYNGTNQAEYIGNMTILTGNKNVDDAQRIVRWRGLDNAPYWLTEWGRMLNGTDGTRFPPFLKRDAKVWAFIPDICRSVEMVYEKDVSFFGIDLLRFHFPDNLFANHSTNPDNIAFCTDNQTCWGRGLLPVSKCIPKNPPILLSPPHFYNSDPRLVKEVDGLKPNRALHDTVVDVEPITGLSLRGHKRIQINVMARKYWLEVTKKLKYDINILPIVIFEENDAVDQKTAKEVLIKQVLLPKRILYYAHYSLIGLSSLVVLVALTITTLMVSDFYQSNQYKEEVQRSKAKTKSDVAFKVNSGCEEKPKIDFKRENSTANIIENEFACDMKT